ncbi:MAG: hypothetical protein KGZ64_09135, partial [Thermaerobacter sp.]|nr:hypothetical protein [Thermaerobacter sp.]
TPIFDPSFSNSSYGFRPNRSTHQAVKQAKQYIEDGYRYVVDLDLEKFFDRVNHDILMARVARKIKDKRILGLIRAYLNAGIMAKGVCVRSEQGVPQGGLSKALDNPPYPKLCVIQSKPRKPLALHGLGPIYLG